jgi:hypothetical protein
MARFTHLITYSSCASQDETCFTKPEVVARVRVLVPFAGRHESCVPWACASRPTSQFGRNGDYASRMPCDRAQSSACLLIWFPVSCSPRSALLTASSLPLNLRRGQSPRTGAYLPWRRYTNIYAQLISEDLTKKRRSSAPKAPCIQI